MMTPGLHYDTAYETYDEIDALRSSVAYTALTVNPEKALLKKTASRKMDFGTVCHALLLKGEENVKIIEADTFRTKTAQEQRNEAQANGRIAILEKDAVVARTMADRVREQFPMMSETARTEVTCVWEDDLDLPCKARIDWLGEGIAIDLKTTSQTPQVWSSRTLWGGPVFQAAFYLRGLRKIMGSDELRFVFLVVEVEEPFQAYMVEPDAYGLAIAAEQVEAAIRLCHDCAESGVWPGYSRDIHYVGPPPWFIAQWEERKAKEKYHDIRV